jgi:hypothetical protein
MCFVVPYRPTCYFHASGYDAPVSSLLFCSVLFCSDLYQAPWLHLSKAGDDWNGVHIRAFEIIDSWGGHDETQGNIAAVIVPELLKERMCINASGDLWVRLHERVYLSYQSLIKRVQY